MSTLIKCLLSCLACSMCWEFVHVSYSSPTLCTFFLEMLLKASMPWARVGPTCPYDTIFCPTLLPHHTWQLIWSLGKLRLSQLEHQFLHCSGPWLLCSRCCLFAPQHTILPIHYFFLLSSLLLVFVCCIFPLFPACLWQFVLSTSSSRCVFSLLFRLVFLW